MAKQDGLGQSRIRLNTWLEEGRAWPARIGFLDDGWGFKLRWPDVVMQVKPSRAFLCVLGIYINRRTSLTLDFHSSTSLLIIPLVTYKKPLTPPKILPVAQPSK